MMKSGVHMLLNRNETLAAWEQLEGKGAGTGEHGHQREQLLRVIAKSCHMAMQDHCRDFSRETRNMDFHVESDFSTWQLIQGSSNNLD